MGHAVDFYPGPGELGRHPDHTADQIEAGLWELALCGGNQSMAARQLAGAHPDWNVTRDQIARWARGRFRARYDEIRTIRAQELEEHSARINMDFVAQAGDAQLKALRRTMAELDNADAVGASVILRNVSQARATSLDQATAVRGRFLSGPKTNLVEVIAALSRLGVGRAEYVDAEAEVVEPAPSPALPTGDQAPPDPPPAS